MSKEQEILNLARFRLGDEEFKIVVATGYALAGVIEEDVAACWPKWTAAAEAGAIQVDGKPRMASPNMALASVLIGAAVGAMTEKMRADGREKFMELCGAIFDIQVEAMAAVEKGKN